MSDEKSEFIIYQTENSRTRIQCRFNSEVRWLRKITSSSHLRIRKNRRLGP